jgi:hypothetical protein
MPPLWGGGFFVALTQLTVFYYSLGAVLHFVLPWLSPVKGIQEQQRKPGEVSRDAFNSLGKSQLHLNFSSRAAPQAHMTPPTCTWQQQQLPEGHHNALVARACPLEATGSVSDRPVMQLVSHVGVHCQCAAWPVSSQTAVNFYLTCGAVRNMWSRSNRSQGSHMGCCRANVCPQHQLAVCWSCQQLTRGKLDQPNSWTETAASTKICCNRCLGVRQEKLCACLHATPPLPPPPPTHPQIAVALHP